MITCLQGLGKRGVTAACVRVADHADTVDLPAGQVAEGAVGSAGVAGGGATFAVHR